MPSTLRRTHFPPAAAGSDAMWAADFESSACLPGDGKPDAVQCDDR